MAQQIARIGAPLERSTSGEPEELGRDWLVLRECRLRPSDRGGLPSVLIHPARGIAVVDVLPAETPGAVEALRGRLDAVRFPAIFAGHLPVVHLRVTPRQVAFLPALLDDAFAAQPPLSLPGGDAWAGVAERALTGEQRVARMEARSVRGGAGRRRRRRRWRGASSALRTAGTLLLCGAALGGVLALALGEPPVPASAPVADVVPAERVEGSVPREAALPSAPVDPVVAAPPPVPSPSGAETAAPPPEQPRLAPPSPPSPSRAEPPPARPPQGAGSPPPRRSEAAAPPAARAAPERAASRRRPEGGAAPPAADAAPSAEAAPQRCGRVAALIGSGAPLGEADMRFFNEACIRW